MESHLAKAEITELNEKKRTTNVNAGQNDSRRSHFFLFSFFIGLCYVICSMSIVDDSVPYCSRVKPLPDSKKSI